MLPGTPDNPSPEAQIARMAFEFMQRCEFVKPREIRQYEIVMNWLEAKMNVDVDPNALADPEPEPEG